MATVKLNKGYNINPKRRAAWNYMRLFHCALLVFSFLILLCVGLAIGYISRFNVREQYREAGNTISLSFHL